MSERGNGSSIILALDCETLPSVDSFSFEFTKVRPEIKDVPENGRLKDPEKVAEWKVTKLLSLQEDWEKEKLKAREDAEKEWRQESLSSFRGRICCMSYAKSTDWKRIKTIDFVGGEKQMLETFWNDIKPYGVIQYLGSNLKYDMLFLFHRALHFKLYDLAEELRMDRSFSKTKMIELMDLASGNIEWKYRISLDNICKLLGVKSPKGNGIDGSKVLDYYLAGRLNEIKEYNRADVSQLIECYQILK